MFNYTYNRLWTLYISCIIIILMLAIMCYRKTSLLTTRMNLWAWKRLSPTRKMTSLSCSLSNNDANRSMKMASLERFSSDGLFSSACFPLFCPRTSVSVSSDIPRRRLTPMRAARDIICYLHGNTKILNTMYISIYFYCVYLRNDSYFGAVHADWTCTRELANP